jgi:solute carrier family 6 GABA transporter-like protein 1
LYNLKPQTFPFKVLGVDSEFCNVEALVTGIVDNWPETLLKHRRLFTVALCGFMFAMGLPMCTEGGVFLFQLMDFYSASGMSLLWVCFFQTIAIGWFFGAGRFCDCVEQMTGHKPNIFWYMCWKYFAPAVMGVSDYAIIVCMIDKSLGKGILKNCIFPVIIQSSSPCSVCLSSTSSRTRP